MGLRGPKRKRGCTDEEMNVAIASNRSIAGVLRSLGLRVAGANYQKVHWHIRQYRPDTSHWTGAGHRKGSTVPVVPAMPLERLLVNGCNRSSSDVRQRLLREGIFAPKCANCALERWQGMPISLELDHIDGDRFNNDLKNLRLLCPNCHAQTPTYRGRNIKMKWPGW